MFLSSFFVFVASNKSKGSEIRFRFNWLLGMGMFAYGLSILVYTSIFEQFITIAVAFLLYFGIMEIIFGFGLMAYKKTISLQIIVYRMIIGLLMTIGAFFILGKSVVDKTTSLLVARILIFLNGVNFIILANEMQKSSRHE